MKAFLIQVTFSDPYPKTKEYREEATYLDFAIKKAAKKFRKDFKGKRLKSGDLHWEDLGTIPKAQEIPGLAEYLPTEESAREIGVTRPRKKLAVSHDPAMDFLNKAMQQIM